MTFPILLIGPGSIGRRHARNLKGLRPDAFFGRPDLPEGIEAVMITPHDFVAKLYSHERAHPCGDWRELAGTPADIGGRVEKQPAFLLARGKTQS